MSLDWIKSTFTEPTGLQPDDVLIRLASSIGCGLLVAGLHRWTHPPSKPESPRLGTSLVMLCVLIAMVSQVVGNNAARAFSLVGALSVIRFRTPLEDTRDTAFVLFAVIEGMAVGVGYFFVALAGIAAAGIASTGYRHRNQIRNVWVIDIRVPAGKSIERLFDSNITALVERFDFLSGSAKKGDTMEYRYKIVLKPGVSPLRLMGEMGKVDDVQNVDIKQV